MTGRVGRDGQPGRLSLPWLRFLPHLIFGVLFAIGSSAHALLPQASRPNVVLIMSDDLGWGDVGYAQDRSPGNTHRGHPILQTPNIDTIAASGLVFNRYYAASPVCSPTRASLLTGRHGARHDINDFLGLDDAGKLRNRDLLLSEIARTQGYATGHFGKWHLGSITKHVYDMRRGRIGNYVHYSPPWDHGYQTVFASENWMPTFDPYDRFPVRNAEQAAYFTGPSDAALTHRVPNDARVNNRDESEIIGDQAVNFIEVQANGDAPFFVTVFFSTPHLPLEETPSRRYDGLGLSTNQRRYFEAITAMDRQIGRIRDRIVALGIAEETLLIVTSDNGPQDLSYGSNGGLRGRKSSLFEGGIRVPMVMQWPDTIGPGSTDALAVSSDILPTLVDLWGIEFPDAHPLDGRSLRDVLDGTAVQRAADYVFFSQYRTHQMAMGNQYKLISTDNGSSYTLYDLLIDPEESNPVTTSRDLNSAPSSIRNRFNDLLTQLGDWRDDVLASAVGEDYQSRIASTDNVVIRADAEMQLRLRQTGTDGFGAEVYRDRYQIVAGNTAFEASDAVSVFVEKQHATLDADLSVDADGRPARYDSDVLPEGAVIPAGTVIHSFLLHYDPDGSGEIDAVIRFEDEIIGVIIHADLLVASDVLAFAEPVFDNRDHQRQTLVNGEPQDAFSIESDGKTLSVHLQAGASDIDHLRVITKSSLQPQASTSAHADSQPSRVFSGSLRVPLPIMQISWP